MAKVLYIRLLEVATARRRSWQECSTHNGMQSSFVSSWESDGAWRNVRLLGRSLISVLQRAFCRYLKRMTLESLKGKRFRRRTDPFDDVLPNLTTEEEKGRTSSPARTKCLLKTDTSPPSSSSIGPFLLLREHSGKGILMNHTSSMNTTTGTTTAFGIRIMSKMSPTRRNVSKEGGIAAPLPPL